MSDPTNLRVIARPIMGAHGTRPLMVPLADAEAAVEAARQEERLTLKAIAANLDGFEVPQTLDLIDARLAALAVPEEETHPATDRGCEVAQLIDQARMMLRDPQRRGDYERADSILHTAQLMSEGKIDP